MSPWNHISLLVLTASLSVQRRSSISTHHGFEERRLKEMGCNFIPRLPDLSENVFVFLSPPTLFSFINCFQKTLTGCQVRSDVEGVSSIWGKKGLHRFAVSVTFPASHCCCDNFVNAQLVQTRWRFTTTVGSPRLANRDGFGKVESQRLIAQ